MSFASNAIVKGLTFGLGQTILGSLLDTGNEPALEIPEFPQTDPDTGIDTELERQKQRMQDLRRQSASRSRSLTNITENPINPDSLLRLISGE